LIITEAGRDYLSVVRDALDRIAIGAERLLQRQNAGVLTVSTSPDFAAKWLVHRLGHFAEAHPSIDLRVSAVMHHVDFAREDVDMAVRHGDGNWPGLDAAQLSSEQLFAICSPKLLTGPRLGKPADLLKFPLIHLDSHADWTKWLRVAGISDADAKHGPVLNRARMVIDAAINGQGIALARTTLAAWDLINGRLVRPFAEALRISKTYWIVCPKAHVERSEDRDVPRLVARESRTGFAPTEAARLVTKGRRSRPVTPCAVCETYRASVHHLTRLPDRIRNQTTRALNLCKADRRLQAASQFAAWFDPADQIIHLPYHHSANSRRLRLPRFR
jgi:LysR family glycine cleavage system transcriptional activator